MLKENWEIGMLQSLITISMLQLRERNKKQERKMFNEYKNDVDERRDI